MPNTPDIDGGTEVLTESETKLEKPKLFKVLLHNDDFTTMEFVISVLETVFGHTEAQATAIMLHVHHRGVGVAGVFPLDIAETKAKRRWTSPVRRSFPCFAP